MLLEIEDAYGNPVASATEGQTIMIGIDWSKGSFDIEQGTNLYQSIEGDVSYLDDYFGNGMNLDGWIFTRESSNVTATYNTVVLRHDYKTEGAEKLIFKTYLDPELTIQVGNAAELVIQDTSNDPILTLSRNEIAEGEAFDLEISNLNLPSLPFPYDQSWEYLKGTMEWEISGNGLTPQDIVGGDERRG